MLPVVIVVSIAFVISACIAVCGVWAVAKGRRDIEREELAMMAGDQRHAQDQDNAAMEAERARHAMMAEFAGVAVEALGPLMPVLSELLGRVADRVGGDTVSRREHEKVVEAGRVLHEVVDRMCSAAEVEPDNAEFWDRLEVAAKMIGGPHECRVINEQAELEGRIERLDAFTDTDVFKGLACFEQRLLERQLGLMREYNGVLLERIKRAEMHS